MVFESSNRFGGWINTKKIKSGDNDIIFEKGPRTLRLATGEAKELNSLQLVNIQSESFCFDHAHINEYLHSFLLTND